MTPVWGPCWEETAPRLAPTCFEVPATPPSLEPECLPRQTELRLEAGQEA